MLRASEVNMRKAFKVVVIPNMKIFRAFPSFDCITVKWGFVHEHPLVGVSVRTQFCEVYFEIHIWKPILKPFSCQTNKMINAAWRRKALHDDSHVWCSEKWRKRRSKSEQQVWFGSSQPGLFNVTETLRIPNSEETSSLVVPDLLFLNHKSRSRHTDAAVDWNRAWMENSAHHLQIVSWTQQFV